MKVKHHAKLIHEGQYAARVNVELTYSDTGWSPYLSLEDAYKLDDVRDALKQGDTRRAAQFGKVFTLTPVEA